METVMKRVVRGEIQSADFSGSCLTQDPGGDLRISSFWRARADYLSAGPGTGRAGDRPHIYLILVSKPAARGAGCNLGFVRSSKMEQAWEVELDFMCTMSYIVAHSWEVRQMPTNSVVRARIDQDIKTKQKPCSQLCGLTVSDAFSYDDGHIAKGKGSAF